MLHCAFGAVVRSAQIRLRTSLIGPVIAAHLRWVAVRASGRGCSNSVHGPGTLGNSDPSAAATVRRTGFAAMKLPTAYGDRIALGELECERLVVHSRAAEICEVGKCACRSVDVACGERSAEISSAIAEIERLRGVGSIIELVNQGCESCDHGDAVAARTRPRLVECRLRKWARGNLDRRIDEFARGRAAVLGRGS